MPCRREPPPPGKKAFNVRRDELNEKIEVRSLKPLKEPFIVRTKNKHKLRENKLILSSSTSLPPDKRCKEYCQKKKQDKKPQKKEEPKKEEPKKEEKEGKKDQPAEGEGEKKDAEPKEEEKKEEPKKEEEKKEEEPAPAQ